MRENCVRYPILSLDLAARTGVAYRESPSSDVELMVWEFDRGQNVYSRADNLRMLLADRILHNGIRSLVYEETFPHGHATRQMVSMEYSVHQVCRAAGCEYMTIAPGTWKKAICGNGRMSHDEYHNLIRRLSGLDIRTNDEAAAWALLRYAELNWEPKPV